VQPKRTGGGSMISTLKKRLGCADDRDLEDAAPRCSHSPFATAVSDSSSTPTSTSSSASEMVNGGLIWM
jgi:hypothetical protein